MKMPYRAGARRWITPLVIFAAVSLSSYFNPQAVTDSLSTLGIKTAEMKRRENNQLRLAKMNPFMRRKVAAILSDLESHGYYPQIDVGVYRTPADQMQKYIRGYSKVTWSFHNATTRAGKPDSLAADIVDTRWYWNAKTQYQRAFWLKLLSSAQSHKVTTGAFWGLTSKQRRSLQTAISKKQWNQMVALGWDTAHVEPITVTVAQARDGKRPQ